MNHPRPTLAIVIPAYRPDFFRATLASLVAQTDRRFRVYVGDDAGPPAIADLCASFAAEGLDLVHHRFPENLGRRSLTAHWNRCVALSNEPWVWLFADDDVMSPDCVASVLAAIDESAVPDVLRFDTEVIDAQGTRVHANPPHPRWEAGADFVYDRMWSRRNSYVVEYVFRRDAFVRAGGFPDYPIAWCADDAAWYLFAGSSGIRTLDAGLVRWRASGRNITDMSRRHRPEKLAAAERFLAFVRDVVVPADEATDRAAPDWQQASSAWLAGQLRYLMPIGPLLWPDASRAARRWMGGPGLARTGRLVRWNVVATIRFVRTRIVRAARRIRKG